jgi:hypothetical protein
MRISTNPDDLGYAAHQKQKIKVFLDDVEMKDVETADDDEGIVIVAARDKDGAFITSGDEFVTEVKYCTVRIEVGE